MLNEAQKIINRINDEKDIYEKMMNIYNQKIKELEQKLEENKHAFNASRFKMKDSFDMSLMSFGNYSPPIKSIPKNSRNNFIVFKNEPRSDGKTKEDNDILENIGVRTEKVR